MTRMPMVLVVDDEVRSQEALRRTLEEEFEVLTASSAEAATTYMEREFVDVVLCDQRMPGTDGVTFLTSVRERWPDTIRIIISGYTDSEDIIAGINAAGIYQYLLKPWQPDQLLLAVREAVRLKRLQHDNEQLGSELRSSATTLKHRVEAKREVLKQRHGFDAIVRSPVSPINELCDLIARVAPYDIPVLLTGESGTGKELMARSVHYNSARKDRAFVVENCAAMQDTLLEAELFGHKRGAFTGAHEDKVGLLQRADGGTLFLDEIGETSPLFQVKLLRVLQEGEFRPVGATRTVRVDVRIIAATNRDLEAEVRLGRFREDLYYRLSGICMHVPALRERSLDIPLLANAILQQAMAALGKRVNGFSDEALNGFTAYRWPGNVRELHNEIYRMLALCEGDVLGTELMSPKVLRAASEEQEGDLGLLTQLSGSLKDRMESLEARVLRETLMRLRWNKSKAARELGLSRVGLRSKLARYGLEPRHGHVEH